MPVLEGKRLYTTHRDLEGEKVTKEGLSKMLSRVDEPVLLRREHDLFDDPVGKISNLRLSQLDDGEWAVVGDVEVFDEEDLEWARGFSIGIHVMDSHPEFGARGGKPDVTVGVSTRGLNQEFMDEWSGEYGDHLVAVTEFSRKGLGQVLLDIMVDVGKGVTAAWLFDQWKRGKLSDLFDTLTDRARSKSEDLTGGEVRTVSEFQLDMGEHEILVRLLLDQEGMAKFRQSRLTAGSARSYLHHKVGASELTEVGITVVGEPPEWGIEYIVDAEGKIVEL